MTAKKGLRMTAERSRVLTGAISTATTNYPNASLLVESRLGGCEDMWATR